MQRVRIAAYGFFDDSGLGGSRGPDVLPPVSLVDFTWSQVSPEPFKRFGQLDAISKCALAALELAGVREIASQETAICAATADGCLGADIEFLQSTTSATGASPRLFAYTLPSTVCGEVAIRFGWMGGNVCMLTRDSLDALFEGFHLLASGESPSCVGLGYDAMFAPAAATAASRGLTVCGAAPCAYAFLLQAASGPHAADWMLSTTRSAVDGAAHVATSLRDVKEFLVNFRDARSEVIELRGKRGQHLYLCRETNAE